MELLQRNRRREPQITDEEATLKAIEIGYELGMRIMRKHGDMKSQTFSSHLHREVTEYRMSKSVRRLIKRAAERARIDWRKSNIAPKD